MEVKHFKLISTISAVGSLTKAADKLFLTQSALSHQLKEIEEQLGTRVFNRVNKKLVLTDAGRVFLNSSSVILAEINKVRSEIKRQVNGESGTITLTTECYTCYHWLPRVMRNFNNEFPSVEVRLNTSQIKKPIEKLLAGKVDIAIVYRKPFDKNIQYTDLFTDDVVGLVPVNHPLANRQFLSPSDFNDAHFITQYANFEETSFYENFLKTDKIKPKKLTYIQLTEAALEMVKEGIGITAMAKWLVKPYIDPAKIKVMKLGSRGLKRRWYIASLKKTDPSKFLNRFIEHLKAQIPM
jgi:LysR family transcriptional regulator, regulator for metE and metH